MGIKTLENFGVYLGVLLISLIALYGLASLLIKFAPPPANGWLSAIVRKSSPSGWAISA